MYFRRPSYYLAFWRENSRLTSYEQVRIRNLWALMPCLMMKSRKEKENSEEEVAFKAIRKVWISSLWLWSNCAIRLSIKAISQLFFRNATNWTSTGTRPTRGKSISSRSFRRGEIRLAPDPAVANPRGARDRRRRRPGGAGGNEDRRARRGLDEPQRRGLVSAGERLHSNAVRLRSRANACEKAVPTFYQRWCVDDGAAARTMEQRRGRWSGGVDDDSN